MTEPALLEARLPGCVSVGVQYACYVSPVYKGRLVCRWSVGVRKVKNQAKQMIKGVLDFLNYSSEQCCY